MRWKLIALAALAAASATPAAADCNLVACSGWVTSEDSYPAGETPLPPNIRAVVEARQGRGLSLAAYYNDPSAALAPREFAPPRGYAEAAPAPADYEYRESHRRHGPHVIVSPYGHGHHVY